MNLVTVEVTRVRGSFVFVLRQSKPMPEPVARTRVQQVMNLLTVVVARGQGASALGLRRLEPVLLQAFKFLKLKHTRTYHEIKLDRNSSIQMYEVTALFNYRNDVVKVRINDHASSHLSVPDYN